MLKKRISNTEYCYLSTGHVQYRWSLDRNSLPGSSASYHEYHLQYQGLKEKWVNHESHFWKSMCRPRCLNLYDIRSLLWTCHYTQGPDHNTKGKVPIESQLLHEYEINISQVSDMSLASSVCWFTRTSFEKTW